MRRPYNPENATKFHMAIDSTKMQNKEVVKDGIIRFTYSETEFLWEPKVGNPAQLDIENAQGIEEATVQAKIVGVEKLRKQGPCYMADVTYEYNSPTES